MGVNVNTSSTPAKVTVSTGSSRVVTTTTSQSQVATSNTVDNLSGIDTSGVQNGYTLVYDSSTGNWEASPPAAIDITSIDGGTF
tara:strand:- start:300 stop:551 length:252 start_codon:yes stop_codon:yes gene_type:complete